MVLNICVPGDYTAVLVRHIGREPRPAGKHQFSNIYGAEITHVSGIIQTKHVHVALIPSALAVHMEGAVWRNKV